MQRLPVQSAAHEEELPEVFGQIGRSALAPLQAYLADRSHAEWGHVLVARALGEIGQRHPELRDEVVASLSEVVRNAEQYDEMACTFAMDALVELEAADAVPALRRAFELDKIDTMVRGDWGDILDQLGVDPEPDDPLIARSRRNAEERRSSSLSSVAMTPPLGTPTSSPTRSGHATVTPQR